MPTENQSSIATGNCGASEQTINITWHGGDDSLEIHFVKNDTTKRYYIHHLGVNLGEHEFPDAKPSNIIFIISHTFRFYKRMIAVKQGKVREFCEIGIVREYSKFPKNFQKIFELVSNTIFNQFLRLLTVLLGVVPKSAESPRKILLNEVNSIHI